MKTIFLIPLICLASLLFARNANAEVVTSSGTGSGTASSIPVGISTVNITISSGKILIYGEATLGTGQYQEKSLGYAIDGGAMTTSATCYTIFDPPGAVNCSFADYVTGLSAASHKVVLFMKPNAGNVSAISGKPYHLIVEEK